MSDWRPIETAPDAPATCLGFCGRVADAMNWTAELCGPMRDERLCLIFWDSEEWCWLGTGHAVFEDGDSDHLPTHWTPLPEPPR